MITCDSNVLIYAMQAMLHPAHRVSPLVRSSGLLVNQRRRLGLRIPSPCFGEVIRGAATSVESERWVSFLFRCDFIDNSPVSNMRAARLRRLLGKGPKSLVDCVIYTTAAIAGSDTHITNDTGFCGKRNRIRIPATYGGRFGTAAPAIITPLELVMPKRNPPRRRLAGGRTEIDDLEANLRKLVRDHKARAWRRAKEAGCRTPMEVVNYFASIPRMLMSLTPEKEKAALRRRFPI